MHHASANKMGTKCCALRVDQEAVRLRSVQEHQSSSQRAGLIRRVSSNGWNGAPSSLSLLQELTIASQYTSTWLYKIHSHGLVSAHTLQMLPHGALLLASSCSGPSTAELGGYQAAAHLTERVAAFLYVTC